MALVNNASSFYPTSLEEVDEAHWTDLLGTNLKAPAVSGAGSGERAAPSQRRGSSILWTFMRNDPMQAHLLYQCSQGRSWSRLPRHWRRNWRRTCG